MPSLNDIIKEMNKKSKEDVITVGLPEYSFERIPFTSPRMNYCTFGGLPVGQLIEFFGEEHGGKALVNGTPVLTENGWISIEKLNIGDRVYGEDGQLHNVIGVYPQSEKMCYDFKLRDGTSVECSEDHLWSVYTGGQIKHLHHRDCKLSTLSTKEMLDNFGREYYLPDIAPMQFENKKLLLHPYLLGLLLGDGGILGGTPHFTNTEADIIEELSELVKDYNCTVNFHKGSQCDWRIVENKKSNDHPINHILRQYGLLGKHSGEKFIPDDYKFASMRDRYDLIAGLINTDGGVGGGVEYTSTSPQLINDFWEVCMSLGIYCVKKKYKVRIPASSMTDELIKRLSVKHSIRYTKYLDCNRQHIHKHRRKVESITEIGMRECTCIKVDNPTSLFITKDFIPTHNTTTALDIISNYQQMEDARRVLYVDAENTLDTEWARKLGVDVDSMVVFKPHTESAEEIFEFIYQAVESGEVGLWVLDSIPALSSKQELEKSMEEKTYAGISGPLSVFARKIEKSNKANKCTGIGINQLRDDLGAMYAGATKTPGGRAWKHFCNVRMQFSKGKYIDENGNEMNSRAESPAGNYVLMSMVKNKSCPPTRRTGFYTLNYEFGIDYLKDLVEVAMKYGIIDKSGAWFSIIDTETGELKAKLQGMSNVYKHLEDPENESTLTMVENYVDKQMSMK